MKYKRYYIKEMVHYLSRHYFPVLVSNPNIYPIFSAIIDQFFNPYLFTNSNYYKNYPHPFNQIHFLSKKFDR